MSGTNRYLNQGKGGGSTTPQSGATGPWVCSPQEAEEANLDPQGWFCTGPGTVNRGRYYAIVFFFPIHFSFWFSDIEAQISLPDSSCPDVSPKEILDRWLASRWCFREPGLDE